MKSAVRNLVVQLMMAFFILAALAAHHASGDGGAAGSSRYYRPHHQTTAVRSSKPPPILAGQPTTKKKASTPPPPSRWAPSTMHHLAAVLEGESAARCRNDVFGNVILAAVLLVAGGLVPLGFLAAPLPEDTPLRHKLKSVYSIISVASLQSELLAIVYATVASKKLVEQHQQRAAKSAAPPATAAAASSVYELIQQRDEYELAWVGCHVHFLGGLLGYGIMILIRSYVLLPPPLHNIAGGMCIAALLTMISVVNTNAGIAPPRGDDGDALLGNNLLSLGLRYLWLLVRNVFRTGGLVALSALLLGVASLGSAVYFLSESETYQPGKKRK